MVGGIPRVKSINQWERKINENDKVSTCEIAYLIWQNGVIFIDHEGAIFGGKLT
jgi:hypothetical protein